MKRLNQEKDDLLNALGAEGDIWGDPLEALHDFLGAFEMMPDVQAQIEREFLQNESFRRVILDRTDAYPRLLATIQYGLAHRGNVIVAIDGTQRHGKSTVGRWTARTIHQCKTGSADGWEDHVIYEQAYSNTAIRLQEVARRLMEECQGNAEALLERIRSYCVILDEQWIEHEKDSQKAIDDLLRNILITCAVSGIAFIFISALRRHVGAYFRIWVVGIDSEHQRNLSFYYDMDGFCHGYLVTPNVGETTTYKGIKANAVAEMLLSAGRKAAVVKLPDGQPAPQETPVQLIVEPNADFMTILAQSARQLLLPILKEPRFVDRWLHRYIQGESYEAIADWETDTTGQPVREESIRVYLKEQHEKHIPNTTIGAILEEALTAYLNATIPTISALGTVASPAPSQQIFRRFGGPGAPDVAARDGAVQVNCKLMLHHEPEGWQPPVDPECDAPHGYLLLVELGPHADPPTPYRLHPGSAHVNTHAAPGAAGFVEKLTWEAWLDQLRALTAPSPASSPAASPPPPGAPPATTGRRRPRRPAPESAAPLAGPR